MWRIRQSRGKTLREALHNNRDVDLYLKENLPDYSYLNDVDWGEVAKSCQDPFWKQYYESIAEGKNQNKDQKRVKESQAVQEIIKCLESSGLLFAAEVALPTISGETPRSRFRADLIVVDYSDRLVLIEAKSRQEPYTDTMPNAALFSAIGQLLLYSSEPELREARKVLYLSGYKRIGNRAIAVKAQDIDLAYSCDDLMSFLKR